MGQVGLKSPALARSLNSPLFAGWGEAALAVFLDKTNERSE